MITICVPFEDSDLIAGAKNFRIKSGHGDGVKGKDSFEGANVVTPSKGKLSDLGPKDILYVLAHGRSASNSEIVGVGMFGFKHYMKAKELANFLRKKGLPIDFIDLRLMVCWGGFVGDSTSGGLTRKSNEAPFAGLLCSEMKGIYTNIRVTGYRGMVKYSGKKSYTTMMSLNIQLVGKKSPESGGALHNEMENSLGNNSFSYNNDFCTVWY